MLKLTLEEKAEIISEDVLETEIQQDDECQEKIFEVLVKVNCALPQLLRPTLCEPEDRTGTRSHGAKVKLSVI